MKVAIFLKNHKLDDDRPRLWHDGVIQEDGFVSSELGVNMWCLSNLSSITRWIEDSKHLFVGLPLQLVYWQSNNLALGELLVNWDRATTSEHSAVALSKKGRHFLFAVVLQGKQSWHQRRQFRMRRMSKAPTSLQGELPGLDRLTRPLGTGTSRSSWPWLSKISTLCIIQYMLNNDNEHNRYNIIFLHKKNW